MKIIAEMCQNHNGDISILKDMVASAAEAGARYAKIQNIYAEDLSRRAEFELGIKEDGKTVFIKRPYDLEYKRLKKLELSLKEQELFISECNKFGLIPVTTAFNIQRLPEIKELGFNSVKVASYDCGSTPLIEKLVGTFDEIIVSTGASFDQEVEKTGAFLKKSDVLFSFLHCVTIYPTPVEQMNLERMNYLKKYSDIVGLSNHSLTSRDGVDADLVAIFLGANLIERHYTILSEDETKDGVVSIGGALLEKIMNFSLLSKEDQKDYLEEFIPNYELMYGCAQRELSEEEMINRRYYRGRFCNKVGELEIFNWDDSFNWSTAGKL